MIIVGLFLNVIMLAIVACFLRPLRDIASALEQIVVEQRNVVEQRGIVAPIIAAEPNMTAEPIMAAEQKELVELNNEEVKPVGTGSVSPALVAVITGAIAACLDDVDMERHTISSIQATP